MDLKIANDTALVTGSSSGLGKASATSLAREGVNVMINGRQKDQLDLAMEEIHKVSDTRVAGSVGDLTRKSDVEAIVQDTIDNYDKLDHLIISTGGPPRVRFKDTDEQGWYEMYDLLVMSIVRLVKTTMPYLKNNGGTIVIISSRAVQDTTPRNVFSSSIRRTTVGLNEILAKEFAPQVRTNMITPGVHETSWIVDGIETAVSRGEYDSVEDGVADIASAIPIENIGDPDKLGRLVAFLCSPHAGFVNGAMISVDGGFGSTA